MPYMSINVTRQRCRAIRISQMYGGRTRVLRMLGVDLWRVRAAHRDFHAKSARTTQQSLTMHQVQLHNTLGLGYHRLKYFKWARSLTSRTTASSRLKKMRIHRLNSVPKDLFSRRCLFPPQRDKVRLFRCLLAVSQVQRKVQVDVQRVTIQVSPATP